MLMTIAIKMVPFNSILKRKLLILYTCVHIAMNLTSGMRIITALPDSVPTARDTMNIITRL